MKIVFITAGAAGMYCGSCMHDNAVAKALGKLGADCILQPLYTPIRTDDLSVASTEVFFGGIHIYLVQRLPWLRRMPGIVRRLLNRPGFLGWATRRSSSTDARMLGELALAMLKGEHGVLRDEVQRLVHWLRDEMQPDAIVLSNLLIGGCLPVIRREMPHVKTAVLLQGDDAFLDYLPDHYRLAAVSELTKLSRSCDTLIVNTKFYRDKMASLLGRDTDDFEVMPLSIDVEPFKQLPSKRDKPPRSVGYLARVAPEKGLHHLVAAWLELVKRPGFEDVQLNVAGWLGEQHIQYKRQLEATIQTAGKADQYRYLGSPALNEKLEILRSFDLLCVPTEFEEPKGLFVLESLAAEVPVVLPSRGAFPELIQSTGGGIIVNAPPTDAIKLADGLQQMLGDESRRTAMGRAGRDAVFSRHSIASHAASLLSHLQSL